MKIEEDDFILELIDNTPLFDLSLKTIVNKGKSNERSEFKNEAYGITLEGAIKRIAVYRLKEKKEITTLKEFFIDYIKEIRYLRKLLS